MADITEILASLDTIKTHQDAQSTALAKLQQDAQAAIALITALRNAGGASATQLDQVAAALAGIDTGVTSATQMQSSIDTALAAAAPAPAAPTSAPAPAEPAPAPAEPAPAPEPPADPATPST